jgi:hypothetical protein
MSTPKVTPAVRKEIIDWYTRKRAMGTFRSMARKHGICVQYVEKIVNNYKKNSRGKLASAVPEQNPVLGLERESASP